MKSTVFVIFSLANMLETFFNVFYIPFEKGSHYVVQARVELLGVKPSPCPDLLGTRTNYRYMTLFLVIKLLIRYFALKTLLILSL